jgi:hypothetical protein
VTAPAASLEAHTDPVRRPKPQTPPPPPPRNKSTARLVDPPPPRDDLWLLRRAAAALCCCCWACAASASACSATRSRCATSSGGPGRCCQLGGALLSVERGGRFCSPASDRRAPVALHRARPHTSCTHPYVRTHAHTQAETHRERERERERVRHLLSGTTACDCALLNFATRVAAQAKHTEGRHLHSRSPLLRCQHPSLVGARLRCRKNQCPKQISPPPPPPPLSTDKNAPPLS